MANWFPSMEAYAYQCQSRLNYIGRLAGDCHGIPLDAELPIQVSTQRTDAQVIRVDEYSVDLNRVLRIDLLDISN